MIDFIISVIMYSVLYHLIWIAGLLLFFICLYFCINKLNAPVTILHKTFDFFDIIYNWQLSLLFLEFPKTYNETISDRLRRYMSIKGMPECGTPMNILRYQVTLFFAKILNYFDEGHIQ